MMTLLFWQVKNYLIDNGKKVEIIGKIDRVDVLKTEGGNYVRIIDYKYILQSLKILIYHGKENNIVLKSYTLDFE